MSTKVSVMMPVYNCEAYVEKAIQSILNQTYQDIELVIVDDGSTDGTGAILKKADNHPRIKVIYNDHSGVARARNTCLEHCTGDIIARQDADDWSARTRIAAQVKRLGEGYDIVSCKMFWCVGDRQTLQAGNGMLKEHYKRGESAGFPVNASIVAIRDVYDKVGDFDESLVAAEDTDWNFRALGFRWGFVSIALYYYRKHSAALTRRIDICALHKEVLGRYT